MWTASIEFDTSWEAFLIQCFFVCVLQRSNTSLLILEDFKALTPRKFKVGPDVRPCQLTFHKISRPQRYHADLKQIVQDALEQAKIRKMGCVIHFGLPPERV